MNHTELLSKCQAGDILFLDLRFTDFLGKEQHMTVPSDAVNAELFDDGKYFDGSSIAGWKSIEESDMVLRLDRDNIVMDPFTEEPTAMVYCDVTDPMTGKGYNRCPRTIARAAEAYLKSTGIADTAYFGPEHEFYIFDSVRWHLGIGHGYFSISSEEADWQSGDKMEDLGGNKGHRPRPKKGYVPVPPVDSLQDFRSAVVLNLKSVGIEAEVHHHEVGTAGQCEVGTKFDSLVRRGDMSQTLKYIVSNVAQMRGHTATFMPKPLAGDNGSGTHVHMSLLKDGKNIFAGDKYAGLSQEALYFIGGIFEHLHALNAFTNAGINSYKRLVMGFEAPVICAYSSRNRSALIRIPHFTHDKLARVEARFPDSVGSLYLGATAMLMAGLDGIRRRIDPGPAIDKNLYDISREEELTMKKVASTLDLAIDELEKDREFLTVGGFIDDDFIDSYAALKREEVLLLKSHINPVEFSMYYSC
ncbi:MAG: type I glutamate--ammonia ligase [Gammaproteobacteria bacterium]|nr:type I glutamate--ammonia ligase [Pseudomonadota bacterium]MCH9663570.1 type I glutamate--ammonia ligase [Gammaproteobacteria bacterium]